MHEMPFLTGKNSQIYSTCYKIRDALTSLEVMGEKEK